MLSRAYAFPQVVRYSQQGQVRLDLAAPHAVDIRVCVRWQARALRSPDHLAQAFHHFVLGCMGRIEALRELLHGRADAARLVHLHLLLDRQVAILVRRISLPLGSCGHGFYTECRRKKGGHGAILTKVEFTIRPLSYVPPYTVGKWVAAKKHEVV